MDLRMRVISGTCLAAVALMVGAGSAAAAPSISVQAPATVAANTDVNLVYAGVADAGNAGATGAMLFHAFYELGAANCAPTAAAQRGRPNSKFDGQQYIGAPTPTPFSVTSTVFFPTEGAYRVCVYLGVWPGDEAAAPAAFSEAVVQVGAASTPCVVPNVRGLTVKSATARLKVAGCVVGRVFKPRKTGKKTLVVKSQSVKADVMVAAGSKVNLTLRIRKK